MSVSLQCRVNAADPHQFEIYPSIDLRDGRVVRLQQGDYGREIRYDVDPLEVAAGYEAAGAKWLHVVDLDGAKAGRIVQHEAIGRIAGSTKLHVQCGGGVRSREDIDILLAAGARRVVVGTRAVREWPWLEGLLKDSALHGRLTLAVDAKGGMVATAAWQETSAVSALDLTKRADDLPLGAILYTDVARDGMLGGPDVQRTAELAAASRHPVLASGGVGSIDHILPLLGTKVAGVVVGRSLYEGKLDLAEAVQLAGGART